MITFPGTVVLYNFVFTIVAVAVIVAKNVAIVAHAVSVARPWS
jgi:hypothetical protein